MLMAAVLAIATVDKGDDGIVRIPLSVESKDILEHFEFRKTLTEEEWPATYKRISERPDVPPTIPIFTPRTHMKLMEVDGYNVFTLTKDDDYDTLILYVHGGAYISSPTARHMEFCDYLAERVGAKIYVPCYPLAPQHTFECAHQLIDDVYRIMLTEEKRIILMGDSAGGGLALAFAQHLRDEGLTMPDRLVLMSPWVDVTMSNPDIGDYEDKDLTLGRYGLVKSGELWAGNVSRDDSRISPINGDMKGLPPTLISVGNAEMFYPDNVKLYGKMKDGGVDVKLIIGEGMLHVFPLYDQFSEAQICIDMILGFIRVHGA